ncbi:MAG TPA: glycosyltransferase family 4 protein [Burkholderiales bacterium]|nr:glycosyltransferase family 4 protein [Burkholderiales bacterium]
MTMDHLYLTPLISFVAAFVVLRWLVKGGLSRIVLDRPNPRSLHNTPVPRSGGLGLMTGVFIAWILLLPPWPLWLAPALLIAISLLDDIHGISPVWRLPTHFLAAAIAAVLWSDAGGVLLLPLFILATAWMTNLYNFMDGSDGLAGGMAVFGFGFYGLASWLAGNEAFALINFSIAAAALAFLLFNFHPARIFMGDAGSIPLGFLAAALGITGYLQNNWPIWFPLLIFSPFIVDASVTLLKRALKREKIWQAHREHYYQRLVQIGWGHRKTAWFEYALMLATGLSALWAIGKDEFTQIILVAGWSAAYTLGMIIFDRYWKRHSGNYVSA